MKIQDSTIYPSPTLCIKPQALHMIAYNRYPSGNPTSTRGTTSIGITLQRFILYTLASLSSDNNPTNFIFMHVCEFKTKSLEHTCRGSYHYQVGFLWCLSNLSQVVLLVDKKHKIQTKLAIYTCVKC